MVSRVEKGLTRGRQCGKGTLRLLEALKESFDRIRIDWTKSKLWMNTVIHSLIKGQTIYVKDVCIDKIRSTGGD